MKRVANGEPKNHRPGYPGLFFTMTFWAYILKSENTGRHYCGHTSDVCRRVKQHNDPDYQLTKTTKRFQGPWTLVWSQECPNRGHAVKLEKTIKKRGIGRFLSNAQLV